MWQKICPKSSLSTTSTTHTGEKPFFCKVCNKKFSQKAHLIQQQTSHSEIRSFKCSICPEGRFFKTKNQLNHHMVFHYESKYSCSHCGYKAHTKSNLSQHKKYHCKKDKLKSALFYNV